MTALVRQIGQTGTAAMVAGPDSICAGLLAEQPAGECHCLAPSVTARDARARAVLEPVFGHPLSPGITVDLTADRIAMLRAAYARGDFSSACTGCEWQPFCADLARRGYPGTLLHPPDDGATPTAR